MIRALVPHEQMFTDKTKNKNIIVKSYPLGV